MKNIQELNKELAKHRKLLNRAVGNRIIPYINYHHYEVIRIIEEIKQAQEINDQKYIFGIPLISNQDSHGDIINPELFKKFKEAYDEWHKSGPILPISDLPSVRMMDDNEIKSLGDDFAKNLQRNYLEREDQEILNGGGI